MSDHVFDFWAQQGQAEHVAEVLRGLGLTPKIRYAVVGTRGNLGGCADPEHCPQFPRFADVVSAPLPDGVSKRQVDRALYEAGIPGARFS